MQGGEHVDAGVHEGHEAHAADPHDRRVAGPQAGVRHGPAQQQVPDVHKEEEQREREARIPRPPRAPDRLAPDRARRQNDAAEDDADFRGCLGEAIEAWVLQEEEEDRRHADQHHRRFGPDRRGDVQVEDLLRHALQALDRSEADRANVHGGKQGEADGGDPTPRVQQLHSFTVAGKRTNASATNTMSKAASNLSQPPASLKGRPASSAAVASTAQMSGGIMNGKSSTGRSSSAKRVPPPIAPNSVPTATNPSIARAMTASNGPSTGTILTLKNSANSGSPIPSTVATNAKFGSHLPREMLERLTGA